MPCCFMRVVNINTVYFVDSAWVLFWDLHDDAVKWTAGHPVFMLHVREPGSEPLLPGQVWRATSCRASTFGA